MRTILLIILIPLRLIDLIVLGIPKLIFVVIPTEINAYFWRKRAKHGDKCYFNNVLGFRTEGWIEVSERGNYIMKTHNSSTPTDLEGIYPLKKQLIKRVQ